ncbi:hypothetical protein KVR01_008092 [Diaporthe batatas]|uniref:uncharacterized protein n=1 Tax=Diaporthe batatas TaxID=748121 RepID=UPI001D041325|nr:uncharacterized protein KVR01_008092 [Diaporthe batatas]KAG8162327.1 hypothetical protein KVR01_008092 [Diaporthe batatas]
MPTRRAHKKSRLGCAECKRRKIKCDEVHPICWNCTRYGVLCSFDPANHGRPGGTFEAGISPGSIGAASTPGAVNSPRDLNSWADYLASTTPSGSNPSSFGATTQPIQDLELMHHYCVSTSDSMAFREDLRYVWRVVFPQQGYRHPFVMHGLLSLAALHKAYLFPSRRREYLTLGASHHALGLERFRTLLSDIGDSNWKAMLCYASIVVVHVCSQATRSENGCIAEPVRSTWEFFSVLQGFKTTLKEFNPRMTQSNLAPLVYSIFRLGEDDQSVQCGEIILEQSPLPPDTSSAFSLLIEFYETEDLLVLSNRAEYTMLVSNMERSANVIASHGPDVEVGMLLWWAYDVPKTVMDDIRQHKPHALLLLAYFAVILATADRRYWFLHGWAKQLLDDVDRRLRSKDRFAKWLVWPRDHTR